MLIIFLDKNNLKPEITKSKRTKFEKSIKWITNILDNIKQDTCKHEIWRNKNDFEVLRKPTDISENINILRNEWQRKILDLNFKGF